MLPLADTCFESHVSGHMVGAQATTGWIERIMMPRGMAGTCNREAGISCRVDTVRKVKAFAETDKSQRKLGWSQRLMMPREMAVLATGRPGFPVSIQSDSD